MSEGMLLKLNRKGDPGIQRIKSTSVTIFCGMFVNVMQGDIKFSIGKMSSTLEN